MASLQPWMWWALPAVFLPLIIHLLNRLRYKTVKWAATLFLLKANRAATRRAKIRQYLLLASRMLVILFLIWAMSRPLVGGWLGAAAGGAPEVVLILLDRSASMEARAAGQPDSRRAHALTLLARAAKQSAGSRFVLIENVLREPLEIADAAGLAALKMTEATDTAADLPAMFRAALEYLGRNKPGSAEVWVASDLQASNWRPESSEWQDLSTRFASLAAPAPVRVLDFSSPAGSNVSVAVKAAELRSSRTREAGAELSLQLELRSNGRPAALPVFITRDGVRSEMEVTLSGAVHRQNLKFPVGRLESGWGKVELPADEAPEDNAAWFVYAPPAILRAAIVGDGPGIARLRLAAAPDPVRTDRLAAAVSAARAEGVNWNDTAFVVWAAPPPAEPLEKALRAWVEAGGVLLALPPGEEAAAGLLGLSWSAAEAAPAGAPFRITTWDDLDGPLARTENGSPLPLARLEVLRRRVPSTTEAAHVHAAFADGRPFLLSHRLGAGEVFACATLPEPAWSTLGEGPVLLPLAQRLMLLGGAHRAPPHMASAGEWRPSSADEVWSPVETEQPRDWRWHAGVYRHGSQLVALNRPEAEDAPESLERTRLPELLPGAKLRVLAGAAELKADALQSEIWPAMVVATMLFMCAEMLLATSKAMLPAAPPGRPVAVRRSDAVPA